MSMDRTATPSMKSHTFWLNTVLPAPLGPASPTIMVSSVTALSCWMARTNRKNPFSNESSSQIGSRSYLPSGFCLICSQFFRSDDPPPLAANLVGVARGSCVSAACACGMDPLEDVRLCSPSWCTVVPPFVATYPTPTAGGISDGWWSAGRIVSTVVIFVLFALACAPRVLGAVVQRPCRCARRSVGGAPTSASMSRLPQV
mmetsp:Transcript_13327/g.33276  ORF Transcript_13327/g.33276 Transcript_13327/m.33276 type:complete len:201 (-) Transcript_13327:21-623(-)